MPPRATPQQAIERLHRTRLRVDIARAHVIYGGWLRRERRHLDAREQLRTAFDTFTTMGAEAFAAPAQHELLATGERVRTRTVETRDELTAQQAQVAQLARDSRATASRTPRSAHDCSSASTPSSTTWRKAFTKLEITSHNQLDRVLPKTHRCPADRVSAAQTTPRAAHDDLAGHANNTMQTRRRRRRPRRFRTGKGLAPGFSVSSSESDALLARVVDCP